MQPGKNILFVGLGSMGMPMALNLAKKGFTVYGSNHSPAAVQKLHAATGTPVLPTAEAAARCDYAVIMVVNAAQAEDVLFRQQVAQNMRKGGVVAVMSTCEPGAVKDLAKRVTDMGLQFADAPVSGGVVGARNAALSIMAGTPKETWEALQPVFSALGTRLFHVGLEPGQGAVAKAINQLFCGTHIAVMAEAFSLAKKAGVDLQLVFDIVSESSASSWMIRDRGPRMISDTDALTSAVDIFVKDLGIVLATGRDCKAALPLAAVAYQMFAAASGRGEGKLDDSKVIKSYDLLNGV